MTSSGSLTSNVEVTQQQVAEARPEAPHASIAEGLPALPAYIFELNALLNASPVDLKLVAQLIRTDPSLAAQVLRMCHSMPYAAPVTRIEEAVVLVGVERLQALALTCLLIGSQPAVQAMQSFWQHSLFTAVLSERLAEWMGYPDPEKAYLAGLLHDIGELALLAGAGGKGQAREIGVMIAVAWNYPADLAEILECHRHPDEARIDPALAGIVAFAEEFGERCGLGLAQSEPRFHPPSSLETAELLGQCLPGLDAAEARILAAAVESELSTMLVSLTVSR